MKRFLHVLTALLVVSMLLPGGLVDAQSTDKKGMPALKKPLQTPPSASPGSEAEWQKSLEKIDSWQDLLKPQFKGKIVWSDPTVTGSGFNGIATNLLQKVADENYYRKLVATQNITLNRNTRQMAEWLARGKYAVAISVSGGVMSQFIDAGDT